MLGWRGEIKPRSTAHPHQERHEFPRPWHSRSRRLCARPLGRVVVGFGNNGPDRTEGATAGRVYGTYLHGPLLPKNPAFADRLIREALSRRFQGTVLAPLPDAFEAQAREAMLARLGARTSHRGGSGRASVVGLS